MKTFAVIGYGERGKVYAANAIKQAQLTAICELSLERINMAKEIFKAHDVSYFDSEESFFSKGKLADYLFVCVQDKDHKRVSLRALELGYDLLLEKPIATTLEDCLEIENLALNLKKDVFICHVLRYAPFYVKLKEILDSQPIGKIISLEQVENVGFWHMAHSFVRGNWRNSKDSCPMILAKCCHDLDIIQFLIGDECVKLNSVGELNYFKKENLPLGATLRCVEGCAVERTCPYSAKRIYLDNFKKICHKGKKDFWPYTVLTSDGVATVEKLEDAIKNGPYGKCVFQVDNDVVDHQIVQMKFKNDVNATLIMTAFSKDLYREIVIRGANGIIRGVQEKNIIEIIPFNGKKKKIKTVVRSGGGHGGGDYRIIADLFENKGKTSITNSIMSHTMAFAAEFSRKNKGVEVDLKKFKAEVLEVK